MPISIVPQQHLVGLHPGRLAFSPRRATTPHIVSRRGRYPQRWIDQKHAVHADTCHAFTRKDGPLIDVEKSTQKKPHVCTFDRHKKVKEMSHITLPDDICTLLRAYYTCEVTTVNRVGQPITWPCLAYFHSETGQIIVTASIAFRVKALNARQHPQVSLLYSDPSGSGLTTPPAILVQGLAEVQELLDYTDPRFIGLFRMTQERQPASKSFSMRGMRRIFTWYLYQRLVITVTPQRIRVWPQGNFHAEGTEIEVKHVE